MTISQISNLDHFAKKHELGLAIAFVNSSDSLTPTILSKLDELTCTSPLGFGVGFIDSNSAQGKEICQRLDVCILPIVKFFHPDGQPTNDCWIGAEQIIENASDSSFNKDWLGVRSERKPTQSPERLAFRQR